jgi:hypothetical protein
MSEAALGEPAARSWETDIDEAVALQLQQLWSTALRGIRILPGFDGFNQPEFFFTGVVGSMRVTGEAIGPRPGSCVAELSAFGEELYEMPRVDPANRAGALKQIKIKLASLQAKLQSAGWGTSSAPSGQRHASEDGTP